MMTIKAFINFNAAVDVVFVATYAQAGGCFTDIVDFVGDVRRGVSSACPLDGAVHALEDGSLWADLNDEDGQALLELVHRKAREAEELLDIPENT